MSRIINQICKWKQWEVIELSVQDDHIHLILLTSPRYSISYVMQIIKGKSSAWMKKKIKNTDRLYDRGSLWARGYFVSSIGLDEHLIRRYVRHQYDKNQLEQPSLFNFFK